ncbi:perlucin-like [Crassostrea angulata]|uniref:perlucin-like n=1 Tax=Magallana angulata TaxID=2784310 RepID=UPI0022B170E9|nr:perlucin-like [Crassostrea angulata]
MEKGLGLILLASLAAGCRNGWTVNKNSCYHVSRDTASWVEATRMCEIHGSYLVWVESAEEQTFVQNLLQGHHHEHNYWLGGSDWTSEGTWLWEPYGKAINYTNWLHGQPDNSHNAEHCLLLDRHSHYKWKDNDCHEAFHYICEDSDGMKPTSSEVLG